MLGFSFAGVKTVSGHTILQVWSSCMLVGLEMLIYRVFSMVRI